ncbi:MAG: MarP family serine protease [Actinomycetota bacterium]|nr:MarP family serine protease [Actinomycetota bacterium]
MNIFDLALVVVVVIVAAGGYRLGFLARVASWIGLAVGAAVAAWLAPVVLNAFQSGGPDIRLLVALGLFLLLTSLGATLGQVVGGSMHKLLPPGTGLRQADRVAGAGAGALGALVLIWLLLPALAEVPGVVSRQVRNSTIARGLDRYAPGAPKPLQDLRQQVAQANFPQVFSRLRPAPNTGPPPATVALTPGVRARVAAASVQVSGTACGELLLGSGFSPAPDTIVTNAHVVAGVSRPSVIRPDGTRLAATVEVFDAVRDLAVLTVRGLDESPLSFGNGQVPEEGAVFGHPNGQVALAVSPARIDSKVTAEGLDLYGSHRSRREVLVLAARLAPGDSGGALVDGTGSVVGVAFAIAPDRSATAYALSSTELRAALAAPRTAAGNTGPCIRG